MLRSPVLWRGVRCAVAAATLCSLAAPGEAAGAAKIPITTSSQEARELYLRGRDLAEALRATDARKYYEQAIAEDGDFALAFVGLANTSGTTKEFVEAVTRAAALAPKVSEGERHVILGLEAGLKNDAAAQAEHYRELIQAYPEDERAHMLMGGYHFGRQEYAPAAEHYLKATAINPEFPPAYNVLGYSYRFLKKHADAERAFKRYIELVPGDPNPYDSYAELLMKMGRHGESIQFYEKALSIDRHFTNAYVGIGNNQLYMDRPEQARAAFAKLTAAARTTGERRTAHFWTAAAYVQDGAHEKAIAEISKAAALSRAEGDLGTVAGDLNLIADILREAGQTDQALAKYRESIDTMNGAAVPEEVKAAARRNMLFETARLAILDRDLRTAKDLGKEYSAQVAALSLPGEVRQQHELNGLIALAEKRPREAVTELEEANQRDPRVLYLLATALEESGNTARAREIAHEAANFNELNFNQAFVRAKARRIGGS